MKNCINYNIKYRKNNKGVLTWNTYTQHYY